MTAIDPNKMFKFVVVDWMDACAWTGWCQFPGEEFRPAPHRSMGWVIQEDDDLLVLSASMRCDSPDDETLTVGEVMAIPKGCIEKVRRVKL